MSAVPGGHAWLPASTGFPADRPPTREEAREAWRRQARGVFDMTLRARNADVNAARANGVVAMLLMLAGGGLLAGLMLLLPQHRGGLLIALHVIAAALLLLAQIGGASVMASDAMAEVTAKSAQAWSSSPLPTSAWVAGKVAFYVLSQAMTSLRLMPFVAASAMLGGVRLREALVVAGVGLLWTFVAGVGVASSSLEPRQQMAARLAARRNALTPTLAGSPAFRGGAPPAATFAILQVALGIAGIFMALPFALGGINLATMPAGVSLLFAVLCVVSPIGAGASAFFPGLGLQIAGINVPMWVISVAVALAIAPAAVAVSRLRWRPPDDSLGLGVRSGEWLAWSVCAGIGYAALGRSVASAAVGACALPLLASLIPALAAGASRLPDLAADAPRRWSRIAGLNRRHAEAHALITLGCVTLVAAVFAPSGMFAKVPSTVGMLLLSIAVVPLVFVAASMGRETRKGMARIEAGVKDRKLRPATLMFVAMVMASFAPVGAAMLTAGGMHELGAAVNVSSLLSPLHLVIALGRDVLGLQIPAGSGAAPSASLVPLGLAGQAALAALARYLERRSTASDDFAYTAPPGE